MAGLLQTTQFAGSNGYGEFSLSPSGGWTYSSFVQPAVGAWVLGQAYVDRLTFSTPGGTERTIEVSLRGFNMGTATAPQLRGSVLGHSLALGADTTAPVVPNARLVLDTGNGLPGTDGDGVTRSGALVPPTNTEWRASLAYRMTKDDGVPGVWRADYVAPATDGSADGAYAVEVRQTDSAGHASTQVIRFTLDTRKPATPNAKLMLDSSLGVLGNDADGVTSNPAITPPTNTEPGAKVEYRITNGTGTPSGWSSTYTAPTTDGSADGAYTVAVRQTDAAGNVSDVQSVPFTLLTSSPVAAPTIALDAGSDSGVKGDGLTNTPTPTLTGQANANAWVNVYSRGTLLDTVQANGSGVWQYTVGAALADGSASFTAKQLNAIGHEGAASTALAVTVDRAVGIGPVRYLTLVNWTTPFGWYQRFQEVSVYDAAGQKINLIQSGGSVASIGGNLPGLINGIADEVTLMYGSGGLGWLRVDLGAAYSVSRIDVTVSGNAPNLRSSGYQVYGSASDSVVGGAFKYSSSAQMSADAQLKYVGVVNSSTAGQTLAFIGSVGNLSVLQPSAPGAQPQLQGTGEAGAMVEVFDTVVANGSASTSSLGKTMVKADGSWRLQATGISSGTHSISLQQTDMAGNTSSTSIAYTFTVDSTAMGLPLLLNASDSGTQGDNTTNNILPTIRGTALSVGNGSNSVEVYDNGQWLGSAVIDSGAKTWRFTPTSSLSSGVHSITTKDVAAGKTSNALSLEIDTVCAAPVIDALADTRSAPVVSGTGEAGSTITLTATPADASATQTYTAQVKANGTWSVDTGAVQGGYALVAGRAYTLHASAIDAAGNVAAAAVVGHVLYDSAMDAKLLGMDWRMDAGNPGQLGAGDVLRLRFDQAVALTAGSLPTAVFGSGALVAAVEPVGSTAAGTPVSTVWDVRLGSGQTLGGASGVVGSALAAAGPSWALAGVGDTSGNVGTVPVATGSLAALATQVQAGQAPTWQVGMADVQDAGTVVQGWATPGANLKLNWGGQLTNAFTADAQGYWSTTFYKNEAYSGRKVPQADVDQTLTLLQVNTDSTTTPLWSQTARVETAPVQEPMALPGGATARPLSVQLAVRAGRSVALDVRDATQEMPAGSWQLKVSGLAPYMTLNRGSRDSAGVWTVDASDWANLRISTTTNTVQENRVLTLSYQQQQGSGGTAVWTTQRQASVGLSVVPWVQIPAGTTTEDWAGFTQVQQAWNLGLKGLSGAGINIGDHEGSAVDLNQISNFDPGNVLAGTYTGYGSSHAHGVGLRAAGSIRGPFVGIAYGANIKWYDSAQGMDVTNWSVGAGSTSISRLAWDDVDVTQRNGLGNVWMVSAGNHYVYMTALLISTKGVTGITVASIGNATGTHESFSDRGPGLWVAHPGNGGTSYASPAVAGQAALMLQANPGLGTRDVKNILALAATYYTTATPLDSFALNHARSLNGAGMHYSDDIGFGVSNAYNAVRLAADWLADGSAPKVMQNWQTNSATVATTPVSVATPANTVTTVSVVVTADVKLEALQIMCNMNSVDSFDKMRMVVTSPSGTVSVLADGTTVGSYVNSLLMTSNQFFGESSKGTWTVSFEFNANATTAATVSNLFLQMYGAVNEVDDKYVYTDQFSLHWQLADAATRAQMGWLSDNNGGNDSLMLSAMNTDVQVHLGRHGWMTSPSFKVLMVPGTQMENAFGGDGNDVLVGLANAKSILRGNEGSDVLMAYGLGSTLDGGNADDWLWLGGNTTAVGGQGNDRFVVFQGESLLTSTAAVRARMGDFDTTQDSLMVYNAAGSFKLAQFDVSGNLSGWAEVTNTSVLQTLRSQLAQSDAPDVLGVTVAGTAAAPTLTLQWDQSPVHAVSSYAALTLNGAAPVSVVLDGQSLSLRYSGVGAGNVSGLSAGTFVLDTSDSQLYSSLGVKLAYQKMYVGSTGADTLNASGQSGAVAVFGQGGNDVLTGGEGADLLATPAGGSVRMTGGQGADVFRLQGGSWNGRLEVTDFSLSQGDRLDLDALLQNIGNNVFVEDCVQLTRQNFDAVLAFDLSGQKAFASSAFTVVLENVYAQPTPADMTLRTLLYGSGMAGVLG